MRIITHKTILAFPAFLLIAAAADVSAAYAEGGYWTCSAYGYSMPRTKWHSVSGAPAGSEAAASRNAAEKCYRQGLNVCEPTGCTNHAY